MDKPTDRLPDRQTDFNYLQFWIENIQMDFQFQISQINYTFLQNKC